jgi:hypothetical protein
MIIMDIALKPANFNFSIIFRQNNNKVNLRVELYEEQIGDGNEILVEEEDAEDLPEDIFDAVKR